MYAEFRSHINMNMQKNIFFEKRTFEFTQFITLLKNYFPKNQPLISLMHFTKHIYMLYVHSFALRKYDKLHLKTLTVE